jgi:sulfur relay (sulfurtransferase) DsrC/TusE family protein
MPTRGFAPDSWSPDLAERTASALGIPLGPSHWHVIGCARELWANRGLTPELAAVSSATGLETEAIKVLFPDPKRSLVAIAGVAEATGIPRRAGSKERMRPARRT